MRKLAKGLFSGQFIGARIAAARNALVKQQNKGRLYRCTFGACTVTCSSPGDLIIHDFIKHEPIRVAQRKAREAMQRSTASVED